MIITGHDTIFFQLSASLIYFMFFSFAEVVKYNLLIINRLGSRCMVDNKT